jgi:BirA family biotin operon repressor/biotin-[acetyl-CoA-carboxylase] ligase
LYKIPTNTLFTGKNIVFVPQCHSTNTLAAELASGVPEGTVVITQDQTAGRGQRGNTWVVKPGANFTLSIILYPKSLSTQNQFALNIFSSLAVIDYVSSYVGQGAKIKWPNDIMIESYKVCGILIENQITASHLTKTIVGIGLNMNQTEFGYDRATSLSNMCGRSFNLVTEFELLMEAIEHRYLQLRQGQLVDLRNDYLDRLYWRHEPHVFRSGSGNLHGVITGIDNAGKLVIDADGQLHTFGVKEVTYIA